MGSSTPSPRTKGMAVSGTATTLDALRERADLWRPIGEDEANFCTRRLERVGADRVELHASRAAIAFHATFVAIGAFCACVGAAIPVGLVRVNGGTGDAVGAVLTMLALGAIFGG